ncbi:hypothetical protein Tsubulata_036409 [Turnera subulata]|uniref:Uncharacterized protein n=1 Tax=Turnera subulata TaxID=218843 RepID=A0A9Q0EZY7_9ROSI|nr:hypothetical protein Tsubulata_036409 [Turnera subulata]
MPQVRPLKMAKLFLVLALCLVSALLTAARPAKNPFECTVTLAAAAMRPPRPPILPVRVECKDRKSLETVYSREATTDSTGTYKLLVGEDHKDELCDAVLVSSPQKNCRSPSSGRDRARVILTSFNGIASNSRYANAMGFDLDQPMSGCTELLRSYLEFDN